MVMVRDDAQIEVSGAGRGSVTRALAMLAGNFLHLLAKRVGAAFAARPAIALLNTTAAALDRRVALLRDPVPGALFANLHVVAVKPA